MRAGSFQNASRFFLLIAFFCPLVLRSTVAQDKKDHLKEGRAVDEAYLEGACLPVAGEDPRYFGGRWRAGESLSATRSGPESVSVLQRLEQLKTDRLKKILEPALPGKTKQFSELKEHERWDQAAAAYLVPARFPGSAAVPPKVAAESIQAYRAKWEEIRSTLSNASAFEKISPPPEHPGGGLGGLLPESYGNWAKRFTSSAAVVATPPKGAGKDFDPLQQNIFEKRLTLSQIELLIQHFLQKMESESMKGFGLKESSEKNLRPLAQSREFCKRDSEAARKLSSVSTLSHFVFRYLYEKGKHPSHGLPEPIRERMRERSVEDLRRLALFAQQASTPLEKRRLYELIDDLFVKQPPARPWDEAWFLLLAAFDKGGRTVGDMDVSISFNKAIDRALGEPPRPHASVELKDLSFEQKKAVRTHAENELKKMLEKIHAPPSGWAWWKAAIKGTPASDDSSKAKMEAYIHLLSQLDGWKKDGKRVTPEQVASEVERLSDRGHSQFHEVQRVLDAIDTGKGTGKSKSLLTTLEKDFPYLYKRYFKDLSEEKLLLELGGDKQALDAAEHIFRAIEFTVDDEGKKAEEAASALLALTSFPKGTPNRALLEQLADLANSRFRPPTNPFAKDVIEYLYGDPTKQRAMQEKFNYQELQLLIEKTRQSTDSAYPSLAQADLIKLLERIVDRYSLVPMPLDKSKQSALQLRVDPKMRQSFYDWAINERLALQSRNPPAPHAYRMALLQVLGRVMEWRPPDLTPPPKEPAYKGGYDKIYQAMQDFQEAKKKWEKSRPPIFSPLEVLHAVLDEQADPEVIPSKDYREKVQALETDVAMLRKQAAEHLAESASIEKNAKDDKEARLKALRIWRAGKQAQSEAQKKEQELAILRPKLAFREEAEKFVASARGADLEKHLKEARDRRLDWHVVTKSGAKEDDNVYQKNRQLAEAFRAKVELGKHRQMTAEEGENLKRYRAAHAPPFDEEKKDVPPPKDGKADPLANEWRLLEELMRAYGHNPVLMKQLVIGKDEIGAQYVPGHELSLYPPLGPADLEGSIKRLNVRLIESAMAQIASGKLDTDPVCKDLAKLFAAYAGADGCRSAGFARGNLADSTVRMLNHFRLSLLSGNDIPPFEKKDSDNELSEMKRERELAEHENILISLNLAKDAKSLAFERDAGVAKNMIRSFESQLQFTKYRLERLSITKAKENLHLANIAGLVASAQAKLAGQALPAKQNPWSYFSNAKARITYPHGKSVDDVDPRKLGCEEHGEDVLWGHFAEARRRYPRSKTQADLDEWARGCEKLQSKHNIEVSGAVFVENLAQSRLLSQLDRIAEKYPADYWRLQLCAEQRVQDNPWGLSIYGREPLHNGIGKLVPKWLVANPEWYWKGMHQHAKQRFGLKSNANSAIIDLYDSNDDSKIAKIREHARGIQDLVVKESKNNTEFSQIKTKVDEYLKKHITDSDQRDRLVAYFSLFNSDNKARQAVMASSIPPNIRICMESPQVKESLRNEFKRLYAQMPPNLIALEWGLFLAEVRTESTYQCEKLKAILEQRIEQDIQTITQNIGSGKVQPMVINDFFPRGNTLSEIRDNRYIDLQRIKTQFAEGLAKNHLLPILTAKTREEKERALEHKLDVGEIKRKIDALVRPPPDYSLAKIGNIGGPRTYAEWKKLDAGPEWQAKRKGEFNWQLARVQAELAAQAYLLRQFLEENCKPGMPQPTAIPKLAEPYASALRKQFDQNPKYSLCSSVEWLLASFEKRHKEIESHIVSPRGNDLKEKELFSTANGFEFQLKAVEDIHKDLLAALKTAKEQKSRENLLDAFAKLHERAQKNQIGSPQDKYKALADFESELYKFEKVASPKLKTQVMNLRAALEPAKQISQGEFLKRMAAVHEQLKEPWEYSPELLTHAHRGQNIGGSLSLGRLMTFHEEAQGKLKLSNPGVSADTYEALKNLPPFLADVADYLLVGKDKNKYAKYTAPSERIEAIREEARKEIRSKAAKGEKEEVIEKKALDLAQKRVERIQKALTTPWTGTLLNNVLSNQTEREGYARRLEQQMALKILDIEKALPSATGKVKAQLEAERDLLFKLGRGAYLNDYVKIHVDQMVQAPEADKKAAARLKDQWSKPGTKTGELSLHDILSYWDDGKIVNKEGVRHLAFAELRKQLELQGVTSASLSKMSNEALITAIEKERREKAQGVAYGDARYRGSLGVDLLTFLITAIDEGGNADGGKAAERLASGAGGDLRWNPKFLVQQQDLTDKTQAKHFGPGLNGKLTPRTHQGEALIELGRFLAKVDGRGLSSLARNRILNMSDTELAALKEHQKATERELKEKRFSEAERAEMLAELQSADKSKIRDTLDQLSPRQMAYDLKYNAKDELQERVIASLMDTGKLDKEADRAVNLLSHQCMSKAIRNNNQIDLEMKDLAPLRTKCREEVLGVLKDEALTRVFQKYRAQSIETDPAVEKARLDQHYGKGSESKLAEAKKEATKRVDGELAVLPHLIQENQLTKSKLEPSQAAIVDRHSELLEKARRILDLPTHSKSQAPGVQTRLRLQSIARDALADPSEREKFLKAALPACVQVAEGQKTKLATLERDTEAVRAGEEYKKLLQAKREREEAETAFKGREFLFAEEVKAHSSRKRALEQKIVNLEFQKNRFAGQGKDERDENFKRLVKELTQAKQDLSTTITALSQSNNRFKAVAADHFKATASTKETNDRLKELHLERIGPLISAYDKSKLQDRNDLFDKTLLNLWTGKAEVNGALKGRIEEKKRTEFHGICDKVEQARQLGVVLAQEAKSAVWNLSGFDSDARYRSFMEDPEGENYESFIRAAWTEETQRLQQKSAVLGQLEPWGIHFNGKALDLTKFNGKASLDTLAQVLDQYSRIENRTPEARLQIAARIEPVNGLGEEVQQTLAREWRELGQEKGAFESKLFANVAVESDRATPPPNFTFSDLQILRKEETARLYRIQKEIEDEEKGLGKLFNQWKNSDSGLLPSWDAPQAALNKLAEMRAEVAKLKLRNIQVQIPDSDGKAQGPLVPLRTLFHEKEQSLRERVALGQDTYNNIQEEADAILRQVIVEAAVLAASIVFPPTALAGKATWLAKGGQVAAHLLHLGRTGVYFHMGSQVMDEVTRLATGEHGSQVESERGLYKSLRDFVIGGAVAKTFQGSVYGYRALRGLGELSAVRQAILETGSNALATGGVGFIGDLTINGTPKGQAARNSAMTVINLLGIDNHLAGLFSSTLKQNLTLVGANKVMGGAFLLGELEIDHRSKIEERDKLRAKENPTEQEKELEKTLTKEIDDFSRLSALVKNDIHDLGSQATIVLLNLAHRTPASRFRTEFNALKVKNKDAVQKLFERWNVPPGALADPHGPGITDAHRARLGELLSGLQGSDLAALARMGTSRPPPPGTNPNLHFSNLNVPDARRLLEVVARQLGIPEMRLRQALLEMPNARERSNMTLPELSEAIHQFVAVKVKQDFDRTSPREVAVRQQLLLQLMPYQPDQATMLIPADRLRTVDPYTTSVMEATARAYGFDELHFRRFIQAHLQTYNPGNGYSFYVVVDDYVRASSGVDARNTLVQQRRLTRQQMDALFTP